MFRVISGASRTLEIRPGDTGDWTDITQGLGLLAVSEPQQRRPDRKGTRIGSTPLGVFDPACVFSIRDTSVSMPVFKLMALNARRVGIRIREEGKGDDLPEQTGVGVLQVQWGTAGNQRMFRITAKLDGRWVPATQ